MLKIKKYFIKPEYNERKGELHMKWTYFPRNKKITNELLQVVSVFQKHKIDIDSHTHKKLESNDVLKILAEDFEAIGYKVERSKKDKDKIKMPVLYGECGAASLNFEADAFNEDTGIVIEVEAGRAVTNYQFLKDFFEACCMYEAQYLCIAVRQIYGTPVREDYKKVCDFFDAMYASDRFSIPLKGILIVGY